MSLYTQLHSNLNKNKSSKNSINYITDFAKRMKELYNTNLLIKIDKANKSNKGQQSNGAGIKSPENKGNNNNLSGYNINKSNYSNVNTCNNN